MRRRRRYRGAAAAAACSAVAAAAVPGAGAAPTSTPLFDEATRGGAYVLAARGGRVIAARQTSTAGLFSNRFSLLELRSPSSTPRFVRSMRDLTRASLGTDARGRLTIVAAVCPELCHLTAVDLASGHARAIPRTTNAHYGVMDRGRVVFARSGRRSGPDILVALPHGGRPGTAISSGTLARADQTFRAGAQVGPEIDSVVAYRGTIAVTMTYRTERGEGSALFVRGPSGRWRLADRTGWPAGEDASQDGFSDLAIDASGIRAVFEGGSAARGAAIRWTLDGYRRKVVALPPLGVTDAFDVRAVADDHVIVDPAAQRSCDARVTPELCATRRVGPLGLG